jgi:3' terminal RNA ribose 2'-O-methyltransferase Hen1
MTRRRPNRRDAWPDSPVRGHGEESTELHEERLDAVMEALLRSGATSVADLGCGSGALLARLLADPQFTRIIGIDTAFHALAVAERLRPASGGGTDPRLSIHHGSFLAAAGELAGVDAAVMVEVLEHIDPGHISRVERAVMVVMRPRLVVITTPNRDYNERYGIARGRTRHADHRFEWSRSRFEAWAAGVAARNGYDVEFQAVGPRDALLGSPTQMATFRRSPG